MKNLMLENSVLKKGIRIQNKRFGNTIQEKDEQKQENEQLRNIIQKFNSENQILKDQVCRLQQEI